MIKVKSLGIQKLDVYDIEVEDNHNFFANDILVHNSNYLNLAPLFTKLNIDPKKEPEKAIKILTDFADNKLSVVIEDRFEKIADYLNVKNLISMKRECIAINGFFCSKKKYALAVVDNEGVKFSSDAPYFKIMGLEVIKAAAFPKFIREGLKEVLSAILMRDEAHVQKVVKTIKDDFYSRPINDIAFIKTANEINKWVDSNGDCKKGTPVHCRAAIYYNKYIKTFENNLSDIEDGEKICYMYLRQNPFIPSHVIAFKEWSTDLEELRPYLDIDLMYKKNFLSPCNIMLESVKYSPEEINFLF